MSRFHELIPLLLLLGCSNPAEPRDSTTLEPVAGTWQFVRWCGGIAPQCFEGSEHDRLVFSLPDSMIGRAGTANVFAFRVRLDMESDTPHGTKPSIDVFDEGEWVQFFTVLHLSSDSLELSDNTADGFTSYLRRLSN
jgi:hypothetical protein